MLLMHLRGIKRVFVLLLFFLFSFLAQIGFIAQIGFLASGDSKGEL